MSVPAGPLYRIDIPHGASGARAAVTRHPLLVSLIDPSHKFAEIMAYTEEKGSYSSQKFPRKPEFPR
jgi:hypothetical protein